MTQNQAILNWLKPMGRTISPMQALKKFNCWSLSSRISDLKKQGHRIKSELVTDKKTKKQYARYSLL